MDQPLTTQEMCRYWTSAYAYDAAVSQWLQQENDRATATQLKRLRAHRRKLHNREYAAQSRQRRAATMRELEQDRANAEQRAQELEERVDELAAELRQARAEIQQLRQQKRPKQRHTQ